VISGLCDGIFFGVGTEAFIQTAPLRAETVAAGTSPFITIANTSGRAVVSGGDDPTILHDDGGDFPLDAVGTERDDRGDSHEVVIPFRPRVFF